MYRVLFRRRVGVPGARAILNDRAGATAALRSRQRVAESGSACRYAATSLEMAPLALWRPWARCLSPHWAVHEPTAGPSGWNARRPPRALSLGTHRHPLLSVAESVARGVCRLVRATSGSNVQYLGSTILLVALVLFVYGFFVETPLATIERPMTREVIVWSLVGVILHAAAGLRSGARNNATI